MTTIRRVFVTGAAGFIGARLTSRLLDEGYDVAILIRESTDLSRLTPVLDRIHRFSGDIRDGVEISRIIGEYKPDAIVHLVTTYAVEHAPKDIGTMFDTNVKGTVNLLDAARVHGVKFFLNTSTCAVYEQREARLNETDPTSPQNLYAVTKIQAEEACRFYALNYNVPALSVRLFSPFGPGDHERRLIPYVISSLLAGQSPNLTTGLQKWDFVYVDDIAEAFLAVLAHYPYTQPYEVVNIGTGDPVSVRDMVLTTMRLTGKEIPLSWGAVPHRKNEVWFNSANTSKAKDLLGWSAKIDTETGLRETIGYWKRKKGIK